MARHRNVRTMNIDDEYDDEDSLYGHSVPDDNYCISPGTVAQFTYNRDRAADLSSFMGRQEIPEEEEEIEFDVDKGRRDSTDLIRPTLSDKDQDRLNKCLEEIRGVVAETFPEQLLIETVVAQDYDTHRALDKLLTQQDAPKPQREPRSNRRNRSQGDDYGFSSDDSVGETDEADKQITLENSLNEYQKLSESRNVGIEIKSNNQVFRFNSPLVMLKQAVGAKSPSNYGDVPALVPRGTVQKNHFIEEKHGTISSRADRIDEQMGELSVSTRNELRNHQPDNEHKSKHKDQDSTVPAKLAKLSLGDVSDHKKSSEKPPSLADLGKQHSTKQSPLTDLSKKHSSKHPSLAHLSNSHSLAYLSKKHSSKQSCLSDLSKQHSSKQSSLSNLSKQHSSKQPCLSDLSKHHSSKQPSLSNLSKQHSSKQPSLLDLGQQHSSKQTSLSDLNKQHSLKHEHVTKSADAYKGKLGTFETVDLENPGSKSHCKHSSSVKTSSIDLTKALVPAKVKRTTPEESVREVSRLSPVGDSMEIQDEPQIPNITPTEDFQFCPISVNPKLISASTTFGKVLANTYVSPKFVDGVGFKFPSFCYKRQSKHKQRLILSPVVVGPCVPFDFSSPSPDDIVKIKQKQAFTASSRKPIT